VTAAAPPRAAGSARSQDDAVTLSRLPAPRPDQAASELHTAVARLVLTASAAAFACGGAVMLIGCLWACSP
jgi:hypothetical protein